jgi:hypothetical protein
VHGGLDVATEPVSGPSEDEREAEEVEVDIGQRIGHLLGGPLQKRISAELVSHR